MVTQSTWRKFRIGVKLLIALAVIAAFLLPLILLALPAQRKLSLQVPSAASTAWLVLAATLSWLFLLYGAWRLIRALLFHPLGSWTVFGATTGARVTALGITALLAPKAVSSVVMAPVGFLLQLADRLPRLATRIAIAHQSRQNGPATSGIEEPLSELSITLQDMVGELAKAFGKAMEGIVVPEVLVALAVWAILGNLMSAASSNGGSSEGNAGKYVLTKYLHGLSSVQRYSIVLITVFLFGAYLSIAAIVAIPWLHGETVAPALNRENLEKALAGILPATPAQLEERLRDLPVKDDSPLAPLSDDLSKMPKPPPGALAYVTMLLNATIADSENARANATAQVRRMPAEIASRVLQMRQTALRAYDLETASPMGSQERGYFVREIQRSVSSDFAEMESTLGNCVAALNDTNRRLREIAQNGRLALAAEWAPEAHTAKLEYQQTQMAIVETQIASASIRLRNECVTKLVSPRTVYAAPEPGSTWGPFGLVARWLLRTKSFALTLITGMLGFGLLGAVISTFVRGATSRAALSLTSEIVSVLVRGLSAAIVVFLAVKGGLAVFSSGDTEPNAYAVFFTCLIGAVFSEDVWNWAHGRFLDNLSAKAARPQQSIAESIDRQAEEPPL
jgi:hypothetical protein